MKIAVYSLTRDRLEFTKACFGSLWEKSGAPFDHYVLDNGSRDGTPEWLRANEHRFRRVVYSPENLGISRACNRLLDLIAEDGDYDLVIKIDNDCEVLTDGVLARLVAALENEPDWRARLVVSPRVEGLIHQPSRSRYERLGSQKLGVTGMIGGIFLPVSWQIMKNFRYPEDLPLGSGDDVHLCARLCERGVTIGYLEDLAVRHHLTTVGQWNAERAYFARKTSENEQGTGSKPSIDEAHNPSRDALPITVVATVSEGRRGFFEQFCLPAILSNDPVKVVVVAGTGGMNQKRNAGYERVETPFVFFCDDDVILARDCLRGMLQALVAEPRAGYAYGDYLGLVLPGASHPLGPIFVHRGKPFDREELRRQNNASVMSLVRTESFAGWDESLERLADWDAWLTLDDRGIPGVYVPGVHFHAYYLDQGVTASKNGRRAQDYVRRKHGLAPAGDAAMAISEDTAEVLAEIVKPYHVRRIVELGTGTGRSLETLLHASPSSARIWTVDSDPRFLARAHARFGASGRVAFVHAPLERRGEGHWYAEGALDAIDGPIDVLFVDGPEGHVGRSPALEAFLDRLSPRAAIVLDDCHREGERRAFESWCEELRARGHELVADIFPTDRGVGRIQLLAAADVELATQPSGTR